MDIINTYVVPHLNFKGLDKGLKTLRKNTPPNFRVILVDQSGNDNSHLIRAGLVDVIVTANRNLGFAKACNTGLRLADTEYITLMNDDVEFIHPNWWQDLMTEWERVPTVGVFSPHSARNPKATGDVENQYEYKDPLGPNPHTDEDYEAMKNVFQKSTYPAGCMFLPVFNRKALEKLGKHEGSRYGISLLDEAFGQGSGEDYDLTRRLGLIGIKFMGTAKSIIWHWWGETKNNMPVVKPEDEGMTNHNLIAKGYATLKKKWGDPRHGGEPHQNPDGWDVYGRSGPKVPLNDEPFFTINPL